MKTRITNWKFWVFLLTLNFGLNAQNAVTTTPSSSTVNCDGTATVDPALIGSANWNWQQDSTTVLQAGGTTISNLCPGSYFLTFVDSQMNTVYIGFGIGGPGGSPCDQSPISGNITATDVSVTGACDGALTASINATQNYSLSWNNGITSTSMNQVNLCQGNYMLTVTGTNGCIITLTGVVNAPGGNPCINSTLAGTITTTDNTAMAPAPCNGGLVCNVTGGVLPYTFMLNGITNVDPGFDTLCQGTYVVSVHDGNGCFIDLTGVVNGPSNPCANSNLMATITSTNNTSNNPSMCNGSLVVNVTGGQTPYTYTQANGVSSPDNSLFNLCPGMYPITVFDAAGCAYTVTAQVNGDSTVINNPNPCNLFAQLATTDVTVFGACDGSITAYPLNPMNPNGGTSTGLYFFNWSNGATTATADNLCAGVYTVTVYDTNGCFVTVSGYVGGNIDSTIYPNLPLNGYVIPGGETADGACDGNASVIVYGGAAPYTFLFSNGITNSTSSSLCAGLQSVLVTDNNGETLNLEFVISSPANVFTNPNGFPDSTIVDSVYTTATVDCVIDFLTVDSAFIAGYTILPNDSLLVNWTVVFGSGTVSIANTYGLGFGVVAGVYNVTLQIYCPNKSIGNFLTATDQVYYNAALLGITENELTNENVEVYPNPFNDKLTISLNDNQTSDIIITDITGKVVINKTSSNKLTQIDMSSLSAGQYIVTIKNGTSVIARKVVK